MCRMSRHSNGPSVLVVLQGMFRVAVNMLAAFSSLVV